MKTFALTVLAACAAAVLIACGDRVVQPPPLVAARAPDTSTLGAAAATGVLGAGPGALSCGAKIPVEEVLQRLNAARSSGYRCGRHAMGPAQPLHWDASLFSAAHVHSLDMARRNYFEHRSPEGADVAARASQVRYSWNSVGENIAAGVRNLPDAVQTWLDSPDHCENIMNPRFRDVAVACVAQPGSEWGTYWTMVLGSKR